MVIWICGLSGSGKSTLGRTLYEKLKPGLANLVLLDGDELRAALGHDLGHDTESRRRNSVRIANLCRLLDRQGIHVLCCAMTVAPEAQKANREHLSSYLEVYLDVSMPVLESRDAKEIYRRARAGLIHDVAGVDIPYDPPADPHMVVDNNQPRDDLGPLADTVLTRAGLLGSAA